MFENSTVQPGSADCLGIGWRVRGAYWLAGQPFVSLHQQAFNELWWLKVNVLGQTATTATKNSTLHQKDVDPFNSKKIHLFPSEIPADGKQQNDWDQSFDYFGEE